MFIRESSLTVGYWIVYPRGAGSTPVFPDKIIDLITIELLTALVSCKNIKFIVG